MKPYFILTNNTDFDSDVMEVEQDKRKFCKKDDAFMLVKKGLDKDFCEKITKIQTLNTITELEAIVKNSKVYDYTGIATIIRIGKEVMTFEQYKNSIKNN